MNTQSLTIKELLERYNLRQRQSIYNWCKAAKIELKKDESGRAYATPSQIALLDQLAEHMKKPGATLSNFIPVSKTKIDTAVDIVVDNKIDGYKDESKIQSADTSLLAEITSQIGIAIASHLSPSSPLRHNRELEEAAEKGWLLTTAEVKSLIGVKPHTAKGEITYKRGCWTFSKAGRMGNQTAWRVSKIDRQEVLGEGTN